MTLLKFDVNFYLERLCIGLPKFKVAFHEKTSKWSNVKKYDQSLPITEVVFDNFAGFLNIYKKNWYFSEHTKKEIRKGLQM